MGDSTWRGWFFSWFSAAGETYVPDPEEDSDAPAPETQMSEEQQRAAKFEAVRAQALQLEEQSARLEESKQMIREAAKKAAEVKGNRSESNEAAQKALVSTLFTLTAAASGLSGANALEKFAGSVPVSYLNIGRGAFNSAEVASREPATEGEKESQARDKTDAIESTATTAFERIASAVGPAGKVLGNATAILPLYNAYQAAEKAGASEKELPAVVAATGDPELLKAQADHGDRQTRIHENMQARLNNPSPDQYDESFALPIVEALQEGRLSTEKLVQSVQELAAQKLEELNERQAALQSKKAWLEQEESRLYEEFVGASGPSRSAGTPSRLWLSEPADDNESTSWTSDSANVYPEAAGAEENKGDEKEAQGETPSFKETAINAAAEVVNYAVDTYNKNVTAEGQNEKEIYDSLPS